MVGLRQRIAEHKENIVETELEIEAEEAIQPRTMGKIAAPTPEEFELHSKTHLPSRDRCPVCVQAKKTNPAHKRGEHDSTMPVISVDYMYMHERGVQSNSTTIVVHDSESEGVWTIACRHKGDDEYVIRKVANIIARLRYMRMAIKTGQEYAINEADVKIRERLNSMKQNIANDISTTSAGSIVIVSAPVGERQANGRIENVIRRVQEQVRAVKLDIEASAETKLHAQDALWPWLIEFSAQTFLFWRISPSTGMTSIQRIRGRSHVSPKAKFGEVVLYRIPKTIRLGKSEPRWRRGVWMGTVEWSDEHIIGTKLGVIRSRVISQLPDGQRYDAMHSDEVQGTPWKPSTKHVGDKLMTFIHESSDEDQGDRQEDGHNPKDIMFSMEEEPEEGARIKLVAEAQQMFNNRQGVNYSFYIKARGVAN